MIEDEIADTLERLEESEAAAAAETEFRRSIGDRYRAYVVSSGGLPNPDMPTQVSGDKIFLCRHKADDHAVEWRQRALKDLAAHANPSPELVDRFLAYWRSIKVIPVHLSAVPSE